MALKLKPESKQFVENQLQKVSQRITKAMVYMLEYMVAELENHAKNSAGYQDQTGNLKTSIGGVVLNGGVPVSFAGLNSGSEGSIKGTSFLKDKIAEFSNYKGFVLIISAGMEYAAYVEDVHNLNVLVASEQKMKREMPGMLEKLKAQISKMNENS